MACGHVAVVRQGQCRWPRLAVLVCGAWLLAGDVGAEPRSAASEISGITASGAKASGAGDGLLLDPRVLEARILEAMWLLLRDGRAAEAYQLGRSVLTADADSAELCWPSPMRPRPAASAIWHYTILTGLPTVTWRSSTKAVGHDPGPVHRAMASRGNAQRDSRLQTVAGGSRPDCHPAS